jgi:rhodanese-related sulfurtransferase/glyoxylase-like metal-dependent hydrolase (beta-lactamase superfamily II)
VSHSMRVEHPNLKQFRQEGCLSYIFYDAARDRAQSGSGEAILIDPRADLLEEYREYLSEHHLKPSLVVDTRVHWHHLSGSHFVSEHYGVPIAMSRHTDSQRATRRLSQGERLRAGRWELEVLETPGVSPDALCLHGHGMLLVGDTMQIGVPARADLPGGDPAALWRSLHEVLGALPDDTVVLPGYDLQSLLFSTLGVERKRNPDWLAGSSEALARAKAEETAPRGDGDLKRRFEYNRSLRPDDNAESHFGNGLPPPARGGRDTPGVASISVEKYAHKLKERPDGVLFVDVREPSEFAEGHMPGAINFPLSELSLHLRELSAAKRVYFSCRIGRRSRLAARTLDYLGFSDVVDVSGGFQAWQNAGLPLSPGSG